MRRQLGGQTALDNAVEVVEFLPTLDNVFLTKVFLTDNQAGIAETLATSVAKHKGIKWTLTLEAQFMRIAEETTEVVSNKVPFNSRTYVSTTESIEEQLSQALEKLLKSFEEYKGEGSGWTLQKLIKLQVRVATYSPITGNSYFTLPKKLKMKKAVLNIQNEDNCCFKWCVLAHLNPVTWDNNANHVQHYKKYEHELN